MLQGNGEFIDLIAQRELILDICASEIQQIQQQFSDQIEILTDMTIHEFIYPVIEFPQKLNVYNLDNFPEIEDVLVGIKAQYLIFKNGVINIRKYTGYEVVLT